MKNTLSSHSNNQNKLQCIIPPFFSLSLFFEKSKKRKKEKKSNIFFDIPIICNLNAPNHSIPPKNNCNTSHQISAD
jgi:hypothetical protein